MSKAVINTLSSTLPGAKDDPTGGPKLADAASRTGKKTSAGPGEGIGMGYLRV